MIWDIIKDYITAFIGFIVLLIPILFILEVRKSKFYQISFILATIFLLWLGIDKINRDNIIKEKSEKQKTDDSVKMALLNTNITNLVRGRKIDSANNIEFKRNLESKFHIKDSANFPVQIKNYYTHINKAEKVVIGGGN